MSYPKSVGSTMLFCLKYDKNAHSREKIYVGFGRVLTVVWIKYNAYITARGGDAQTKFSPNKMDSFTNILNSILLMLNLTKLRTLVTPICSLFGVKFMLNM